ncbi:MAG TPA: OsmC family protein [Actinomycetota bacterium]
MERIDVRWTSGDRYEIDVRDHRLVVDQPGRGDAGPTPTELWVSGLVACVAHYTGSFLNRRWRGADGLSVRAEWDFATDRPARVRDIRIVVDLPPGFPDALTDRLQAVVEHCTVHNSMTHPPQVSIALAETAELLRG